MAAVAASGSRTEPSAEVRPDPLGPVLGLGARQVRVGLLLGLIGTLILHGGAAARGMAALLELGTFAAAVQNFTQDRLRTVYDIEVAEPAPEPEPPAPPPDQPQPSEPEPSVAPPEQPVPDTNEPPPPAAAQAGKVLTAEPDPSEPLDLTGNEFVTGSADRYAGGTTASAGTSTSAVRDPNARGGGTPGATGTGKPAPAPAPAPAVDKSRPARPASGSWNDCGFPAEADMEQIDFARVTLVVTVGADGRAKGVSVLSDPGYGFGQLARQCAYRKTYSVGTDRFGRPTTTTTPPIRVRFTR